jgi:UDP-perosamine 4-acetyltransferase
MVTLFGGGGLVVIGAGGHSKVCLDILQFMKIRPRLILGNHGSPANINGIPVKSGYESINKLTSRGFTSVLVAIGDNKLRQSIAQECTSNGLKLLSATSPHALISPSSSVGLGSVIQHGAVIDPSVEIGELSIINKNAVVGHDSKIGTSVHIAGQVVIGGGCKIGDRVLVGLGSIVLPNISIGSDIVVGAGSLVSRSLNTPGVYFGSPAQLVKK